MSPLIIASSVIMLVMLASCAIEAACSAIKGKDLIEAGFSGLFVVFFLLVLDLFLEGLKQ